MDTKTGSVGKHTDIAFRLQGMQGLLLIYPLGMKVGLTTASSNPGAAECMRDKISLHPQLRIFF
jgi:hypothetical protein